MFVHAEISIRIIVTTDWFAINETVPAVFALAIYSVYVVAEVVAGESRIPADAGAITLVEVLKVKLLPFDPNKFVEFLYIVSNVCCPVEPTLSQVPPTT
jgi:hypothetical protein